MVVKRWEIDRSSDCLVCPWGHDDNGIEMMMSFWLSCDWHSDNILLLLQLRKSSKLSIHYPCDAVHEREATNFRARPPRRGRWNPETWCQCYYKMILNLTLRVICCVKPREVPIIIFCTLSTTNTTNAHDDFASRKSERESMTFLATICGEQVNAECVKVKRESGAHFGDLFPEAPRSTVDTTTSSFRLDFSYRSEGEKKTRGWGGRFKIACLYVTHEREKIIAFLVQDACKISTSGSKAKLRDLLRTIGVFYTSSQYHLSGIKKKYVS